MTGNLISPVVVTEKIHSRDEIDSKRIVDCDIVVLVFVLGKYIYPLPPIQKEQVTYLGHRPMTQNNTIQFTNNHAHAKYINY